VTVLLAVTAGSRGDEKTPLVDAQGVDAFQQLAGNGVARGMDGKLTDKLMCSSV